MLILLIVACSSCHACRRQQPRGKYAGKSGHDFGARWQGRHQRKETTNATTMTAETRGKKTRRTSANRFSHGKICVRWRGADMAGSTPSLCACDNEYQVHNCLSSATHVIVRTIYMLCSYVLTARAAVPGIYTSIATQVPGIIDIQYRRQHAITTWYVRHSSWRTRSTDSCTTTAVALPLLLCDSSKLLLLSTYPKAGTGV